MGFCEHKIKTFIYAEYSYLYMQDEINWMSSRKKKYISIKIKVKSPEGGLDKYFNKPKKKSNSVESDLTSISFQES